jgi:hypothetical protein
MGGPHEAAEDCVRRVVAACVLSSLLCGASGCAKSSAGTRGQAASVSARASARAIAVKDAPFVAGKKHKVYHARHCLYAISLKDAVGFATSADAEAAGQIPCAFCNPRSSQKQDKAQ